MSTRTYYNFYNTLPPEMREIPESPEHGGIEDTANDFYAPLYEEVDPKDGWVEQKGKKRKPMKAKK